MVTLVVLGQFIRNAMQVKWDILPLSETYLRRTTRLRTLWSPPVNVNDIVAQLIEATHVETTFLSGAGPLGGGVTELTGKVVDVISTDDGLRIVLAGKAQQVKWIIPFSYAHDIANAYYHNARHVARLEATPA